MLTRDEEKEIVTKTQKARTAAEAYKNYLSTPPKPGIFDQLFGPDTEEERKQQKIDAWSEKAKALQTTVTDVTNSILSTAKLITSAKVGKDEDLVESVKETAESNLTTLKNDLSDINAREKTHDKNPIWHLDPAVKGEQALFIDLLKKIETAEVAIQTSVGVFSRKFGIIEPKDNEIKKEKEGKSSELGKFSKRDDSSSVSGAGASSSESTALTEKAQLLKKK